jgi:hypothetical protein
MAGVIDSENTALNMDLMDPVLKSWEIYKYLFKESDKYNRLLLS